MSLKNTPIVLIHGIQGSQLVQTYDDSFDVIWSAIQNRFESIWDLQLDDKGEIDRDPRDLIEVMRLEQAAYGELLSKLRKRFRDVPVYIFRYDWRLDLRETGRRLDKFLELMSKKTSQNSFRIITHSMGGLVLLAFLRLNPKENLKKVARAVLAAPPFHGAPEAVKMLIKGETVRFGLNASEAYRKIARTFPSVYQLVPSYEKHWTHPHPRADIWNIDYWQQRVTFGTRPRGVYKDRIKLMQRHLLRAQQFHTKELANLDKLPDPERRKFLLLYGTKEETLTQIVVKSSSTKRDIKYFFDFENKKGKGDGDGTVPTVSARRYKDIRSIGIPLSDFAPWWPTYWDDKAKIRVGGFHAMFLALDKVQGLVCDWFEDKKPRQSWVGIIKP